MTRIEVGTRGSHVGTGDSSNERTTTWAVGPSHPTVLILSDVFVHPHPHNLMLYLYIYKYENTFIFYFYYNFNENYSF